MHEVMFSLVLVHPQGAQHHEIRLLLALRVRVTSHLSHAAAASARPGQPPLCHLDSGAQAASAALRRRQPRPELDTLPAGSGHHGSTLASHDHNSESPQAARTRTRCPDQAKPLQVQVKRFTWSESTCQGIRQFLFFSFFQVPTGTGMAR